MKCSVLGIISTIGSQISLFSMAVLSMYPSHRVLHMRPSQHFSRRDVGRCILVIVLIVVTSIAVAILPEVPSFENYFTNGLYYSNIPLFVGSITKHTHSELFNEYYGRVEHTHLSWSMIEKMDKGMFTNDHAGISSANVGFYGNDGVCLFK